MKYNRTYTCHDPQIYATIVFMILFVISALSSCKHDDGPNITASDIAGAKFTGTWVVDNNYTNSVTYNSTESRTNYYADFSVTIDYTKGQNGGSYSTSGGMESNSPWPVSGSWNFVSDSPDAGTFQVERDDQLLMDVSIEDEAVILNFMFDEDLNSGGRVDALTGNWTFRLIKQ
ncbi:MAG TPA: hypothetical protein PKL31_08450 [Fulvivirga sp.]|nr:hypothetical protein [Fulvivirga sp.]